MVIAENESERIEVRTTPNAKASVRQAAASGDTLADRRLFRLDDERWRAFQDVLDRPVADKPRLARLLAGKSALEA